MKKHTPDNNKEDITYYCPLASWGDMTGLIPNDNIPSSDYTDVYPFLPKYGGNSGYQSTSDAE